MTMEGWSKNRGRGVVWRRVNTAKPDYKNQKREERRKKRRGKERHYAILQSVMDERRRSKADEGK